MNKYKQIFKRANRANVGGILRNIAYVGSMPKDFGSPWAWQETDYLTVGLKRTELSRSENEYA